MRILRQGLMRKMHEDEPMQVDMKCKNLVSLTGRHPPLKKY